MLIIYQVATPVLGSRLAETLTGFGSVLTRTLVVKLRTPAGTSMTTPLKPMRPNSKVAQSRLVLSWSVTRTSWAGAVAAALFSK